MKKIFISFYIVILFSTISALHGIGPVIDFTVSWFPALKEYIYEVSIADDRSLAKGTFYLIMDELSGSPETGWLDKMDEMRPHFGYPIALYHLDEINLTGPDVLRLHDGIIVINSGEDSPDTLFQRVGSSDYAVAMGPINDSSSLKVLVIVWATIALYAVIPILIWTFYVWRNLKQVSAAANSFGEGDFAARAKVPYFSYISVIAKSFNSMAERIEKLVDSHKELTNAVSHELRTPVTRIKFGLEMLRRSKDTETFDRQVNGVGRDVVEIESLIDEMLTYAKFDRETDKKDFKKHEIVPWLEHLIEKHSDSVVDKELNLVVAPGFSDHLVRFEPKYLEWVVRNLIKNGGLYANDRVDVLLSSTLKECVIIVDDNGPGIPEEKRATIFEPFVRIDSSRNRSSGGYGLGLAIVNRIITWHGGTVYVSESPSGGARFEVSWPLE